MTQPPAPSSPSPDEMRASDRDRDKAAEALREAAAEGRLDMQELNDRLEMVFAAKTYAELAPVTADLPAPGSTPSPAAAAPAPQPAGRFGGRPTSGSFAVAVLSGFSRRGPWVAPRKITAIALLGGGEIDLREARFEDEATTIHAVTVMGGIKVVVPEDAHVQVNGFGLMGGFDGQAAGPGAAGGPAITIDGFALMGGVEVVRTAEPKPAPHHQLAGRRASRQRRRIAG